MPRRRWASARLTGAALAVAGAIASSGSALAQSPFAALGGNWSGAGQVRYSGGETEDIKCRAYYTLKEAGASLGLAILCASPSSKIELRATLNYQSGTIKGSWEERTYNAAGDVSGEASADRISFSIVGGGITGNMAVGLNGNQHTVTISTQGIGMTGVNINVSRG